MSRFRFAALGALLLAGCAPRALAVKQTPFAGRLSEELAREPLPAGEKQLVRVLKRTPEAMIQLIQLRSPIAGHSHEHSDESVYILEGRGTMEIGEESHEAGPGSFFFVPRGTRHAFRPEGGYAAALSMLTPPLRMTDRYRSGAAAKPGRPRR